MTIPVASFPRCRLASLRQCCNDGGMTPKPPKVPNPPRRSPMRPTPNHSHGSNLPAPKAPELKGGTVRVTASLGHEQYAALSLWLVQASGAVNPDAPRRISIDQALRAMVDVTTKDELVTTMVLDQLRRNRGR